MKTSIAKKTQLAIILQGAYSIIMSPFYIEKDIAYLTQKFRETLQMLFKILILIVMLAILFTLFRALYFLAKGKEDSNKTVKSLSWRIGLSIALFTLILVGNYFGWIEPHGLPIVNE